MKELIKKLLAPPIIIINKIILGLYLYIVKGKADDLKRLGLSDEKILILSPHQDDEVLGCGCFIQKGIEQGNEIKCVFMTDGSKSSEDMDKETLIKKRKIEALKVADILKMGTPEFLDITDGELEHDDTMASYNLARIIAEFQPGVIILPYFLDGHKDHSGVSGIFIKAASLVEYKGKLFAYEINSPISVYGITHYADCTGYVDGKKEAVKIYESQTMSFESIFLMNKLNGILTGTKEGGELFREINLFSYTKAYERYNIDNDVWKRFRQMYSIYFMIAAYFKGLGLKKEAALFQNAGDKDLKREEDIQKGVTIN